MSAMICTRFPFLLLTSSHSLALTLTSNHPHRQPSTSSTKPTTSPASYAPAPSSASSSRTRSPPGSRRTGSSLGGFSQGGALAIFTGLSTPHKLAGVFGLSSYLVIGHKVEQFGRRVRGRTRTRRFGWGMGTVIRWLSMRGGRRRWRC